MDLDSVPKLAEETQQRQTYELLGIDRGTGNSCDSSLPSQRSYPYSSHHPCVHINSSNDWGISEELRIRELEEIKSRAAQMEKTMRWWSDCTANWREKWSKVRVERNKAREEGRQLRLQLETTMKELSVLKKMNQDLAKEKEELKAEIAQKKKHSFLEVPYLREDGHQFLSLEQEPVKEVVKNNSICGMKDSCKDVKITEDTIRDNQSTRFSPKLHNSFTEGSLGRCQEKPRQRMESIAQPLENESISVSALHLHLDETQVVLQKERQMNLFLEVEKLESDLSLWKWKYEELRQSKMESLKQLKRLQSENASEWGKREMLDAEKQDLKREDRRLKAQVKEIQELVDRKNELVPSNLGSDTEMAQSELLKKNKEILDLQHAYNKLNKQYQDKVAELMRTNKIVEQHETEVKQLRIRVEDLKRGLNQAEDELDDSLNQIRKLQRSLDEQTEANNNLQAHLNHLKSRLKSQQKVSSGFGIKQSSLYVARDSTETMSEDEGDQRAS
ncbi:PREDICTED: coiled-coil domain-containing protein 102B isoform X1 [Crocodylus porosus]|uniref:coiled-coil domain-containing protein 102B isoform X1 n=1 Tax=Crocodylus porosus TaxID=8502 RepID=UPI00093C6495|nr:PREDICTED: coiled-coil domain-containing protein 102B isoform X1 [Crocodylus porosus]XP_019400811.1 PREDICTED: coiled-coil domain-containing protein 102B isoform X1 [Crocodylus porosus]